MNEEQIKILYVEDDQAQREHLATLLQAHGFEVSSVSSGERAVAEFEPQNFDLVLSDLNMPGIGGLEVLRRIRQCCGETPVVLLTAHGTIPEAVRAVQEGAQQFVLKPVEIEGLTLTLHQAIEHARLRGQLRRYQSDLELLVAERTERLEHANKHLAGLNRVAQQVSRTQSEEQLLREAPQLLIDALDFDRAAVLLAHNGELTIASHAHDPVGDESYAQLRDLMASGHLSLPPHFYEAYREDRTVFIPSLADDPRWPRDPIVVLRADAAAVTPVRCQGRPIGIVVANMQYHKRRMDEQDLSRFESFASLLGLALDNARSYMHLEAMVQQRTESLNEANLELRQKAGDLERSALALAHANVELLSVKEDLEAKQYEIARQRDELQAIIDSVTDPVLLVNGDGLITTVNSGVEAMFGLTVAEVTGMTFEVFRDIIADRFVNRAKFFSRLAMVATNTDTASERLMEGSQQFYVQALELSTPPGRTVYIGAMPVKGNTDSESRRVWFFSDITARKRADEQLRTIIDASPIPLIVSRLKDGRILYANEHLANMAGYTVEELVGRTTPDVYDGPENRDAIVARLQAEGAIDNVEMQLRRRDGERIWCLVSLVSTTIHGESTILCGLYDISRRKQAEEALRISEQRFRGLVEHSRGITYSVSPEGQYTYLSPSFTALLGHETAEFIGRDASSIVHPDDQQEVLSWADRAFASEGVVQTRPASYRLRHKDGRYLWFSTDAALIRDLEGRVQEIIGVAHDISEIKEVNEELARANMHLRQTQAQLVQSEKMASLGMLVAGIAHEINTPIGAVNSMHDTLMRAYAKLKDIIDAEMCSDSRARERIEPIMKIVDDANAVIRNGTDRVMTIVRRLRSFARLDEAELKTVDIHEGLEDTLVLLHHEIKNRIAVERDFGEVPPIACYPGRLNQVFLNLLNNARQAIDGEGTIRIRTRVEDGRVLVSITDTGRGIAPENLKRVFDPGFTTKGVGIGTGLGLSICWGIIEDHRGTIQVESVVGRGTTFTIVLPMNLEDRVHL